MAPYSKHLNALRYESQCTVLPANNTVPAFYLDTHSPDCVLRH